MLLRALAAALFVSMCLVRTAHAGPVEVLEGAHVAPGDASSLMIRYRYAGGGMFISHDAGKSFAFVCNSSVNAAVQREASAATLRSDGSILLGVFDGLWRGDRDGCNWDSAKAFEGQWINDFARDPLDAKRTYAVTSAGMMKNGIFVNTTGSDVWTAVGTQEEVLINRLHVVSLGGDKVRFYESMVRGEIQLKDEDGGITDRFPKYFIRFSDDLGKTWTEYEFGQTDGTVRLLAVDPKDPSRIVVGVLRDEVGLEATPDDILWSAKSGKPGSFQKVGAVGELGGLGFAADGRLFYGDHFQGGPGLYTVAALGDEPKQLSSAYKVGCLHYDDQNDKLYVCQDTLFGTADTKTGAFEQLFDIKQADTFASCGAEGSLQATCKAQLLTGYCGITHYYCTPLCADYAVLDDMGKAPAESRFCAEGDAGPVGGGGGPKSTSDAGSGKPDKGDGGGCAVVGAIGSHDPRGFVLAVSVGLVWLGRKSRRRRGA